MAVLCECPDCHARQSIKNKRCTKCKADLDALKKQKNRVKYWISFRIPAGRDADGKVTYKQRREPVSYSITEARAADGKRKGQKKENRIFEMLPESKMTFIELSEWYLDLPKVKKLRSYDRIKQAIEVFNKMFGTIIVGNIKAADLENYQEMRSEQGIAPATIDLELSVVGTMVNKAFDNDKLTGRVLKAFRATKKRLKGSDNARTRVLAIGEYLKLVENAPPLIRAFIIIAFNSGMRIGELQALKWSHVDRVAGFIRLPADVTKEKKPKAIPINAHTKKVLDSLPRALSGYVFTRKGNQVKNSAGLRYQFNVACKKASIPQGRKEPDGLTFHDIRRTVKTHMLAAGVPKEYRDTILGHSLKGMDAHYLVPSEDDLKDAMSKYTSWLDDQIKNVDQTDDKKGDPKKNGTVKD